MKKLDFPLFREFRRSSGSSMGSTHDFTVYTNAAYWTQRLTGSATGAIGTSGATAVNGVYVMTDTATQNSGSLIYTTVPEFLFSGGSNAPNTGRALYAEAGLQFTEVSTNKANVFFGFCSINTNVILVDSTGTPATNFWGALIYKQTGETVWRCISSAGTTQIIDKTLTNSGVANYVRLGIQAQQIDSLGNYEITFYIGSLNYTDMPQALGGTASYPIPIKHQITSTSAADMYLVAGNKTVEATGVAEVLNLDYAFADQIR